MIPTKAVRAAAADLLAADASTLAPAANANKIALVKADFTPTEALALGDLTFADFDGSTPLVGVVGTQPTGFDPNTDDSIIDIKEPAGGYRFETTGVTNLPQTIYGFALTNNAGTVLLASEKLPAPVTLTAINQVLEISNPTMVLPAGGIF